MCVPCPGSPQLEVGDSLSSISLLFLNVLETWPVGGAEHTLCVPPACPLLTDFTMSRMFFLCSPPEEYLPILGELIVPHF